MELTGKTKKFQNFKLNFNYFMNKSLLTNLIAILIIIIGYFSPIYNQIILSAGFFALSGALTNWIAIHMLFEKIPFLYGSGIIPNRFEDFKLGIKNLILKEFFTQENIEKFFQENKQDLQDGINDKIDFDKVFEGLVEAILESKMGAMLGMFGGKDALQPLKEPIIIKLKLIIEELLNDSNSNEKDKNSHSKILLEKIELIVEARLNELTPKMVKEIIQKMIKRHLGWLVIWGGVFGGIIGIIFGMI